VYKLLFTYRKRRAIEVLLSDPAVNEVVRNFIASFEAYDPLTNDLDSISIQGSTDMTVEGSLQEGFEITAKNRQVIYGLVDRRTDEIVALTITQPRDVTWMRVPEAEGPDAIARHEFTLQDPRVKEVLEGKAWYPVVKVAEIITAYGDFPLRTITPALYFYQEDNGELSALSVFLDVSDPDNFKVVDVNVVQEFTEFSPQKLAKEIKLRAESVLGKVPDVPMAQRPWFTAAEGFHRIEVPPESFQQNGWQIEWKPPVTQGVEITASFRGKPVFAQLAPYATPTGYNLPPREGRSTLEWFFPEGEKFFAGDLLYWDIHSADFGGPGMLGKIDIPKTPDHPEGFRVRTHFHTGATPQAEDFHSGHRFGPYNYDISYDFFQDGVVRLEWRRQGPGFATEFLFVREPTEVYQYYLSVWGMDITPGTTEGVKVQLFDGQEWTTPEEEIYVEGEPGMILRIANPDGPESVDIPLHDLVEVAVVRPHENEIGQATRVLDEEAELGFYHPAQYVDGESIQGERVFTWIIMEVPVHEMPNPAGITSFPMFTELRLQGY
jgi:hypothetical protein